MNLDRHSVSAAPDPVADFEARYPYRFDHFQLDAMRALARGSSVLVAAPTGTGKTVIAEFGIFLTRQARAYGADRSADHRPRAPLRAIYTTPIKALSNQKYRDFRAIYGDEVGLLTGDVVLNPGGSVLVMTTEVLRNMLVQREQKLDDVGVIVFDEVHYVGDKERGTAWEEAILLAPQGVPLVCLSATVPNADEIAAWLRSARGDLECIFHDERAVPLEHRYFVQSKAHLVVDAHGKRRNWFRGIGGELASRYRRGPPRLVGREPLDRNALPEAEPWQVVKYLEDGELTPAIYFMFSRRACEQAAESCLALRIVPGGNDLARQARARLSDLPPEDRSLRQVGLLLRLLPRGVAVHHAGLLPAIKVLVEDFFAAGRLRAVFATDTLALGINMPARTVVIAEMTKWDGEQHRLLSPNEYRQMTGRAGRRGIDVRGVSLILYSPWLAFESAMEVVKGKLLPLESAFAPHYSTAVNLWHRPEDRELLADLYARSLRRFQHDSLLEALTREFEELEDELEAVRRADRPAARSDDPAALRLGRQLARVEQDLLLARRQASYEARTLVDGLARMLERYGYVAVDRPGRKAAPLRHIFDTNALTLAELLTNGVLDGLPPAELAELLSWFAYDREGRLRWLPVTRRLDRLHGDVLRLNAEIVAHERRLGLEISRPLNEDFRGLALAWAEGRTLAEIAYRARLAEGDLVGVLQKTLDLLGQLRKAAEARGSSDAGPRASRRPRLSASGDRRRTTDDLLARLEEADSLLRRGVVEASYRWSIAGPPDASSNGQVEADANWDVPSAFEPSSRRPGGRRAGQVGQRERRGRGDKHRAVAEATDGTIPGAKVPRKPPAGQKPRRPGRTGGPYRGRKGPRRYR
jgi:ATP-dependent RNA helicase HelY